MKDRLWASFKEVMAKAGEEPPREFLLFPEGAVTLEGIGDAYLTETAGRQIIKDFERRGNDMVIDYEHQSLSDGVAPAAGWIKGLVWSAGEGLRAVVEWTQRAKEHLKAREYRYFSPVFMVRATDNMIVKLINVALTNQPKTNHLPPIVAKMDLTQTPTKEEEQMDELKKLLGLAADAAEEKVTEAVKAIVAKLKNPDPPPIACKEVLTAIGAKEDAGKEEVLRMVASLKAPNEVAITLSHEVAALKTRLAHKDQEDLITLALKEGKTSPEELDKWGKKLALENPEQFRLIVLSRPFGSVIPVEGIRVAAKDGRAAGMDETQRAINEMCGVSEETFKKYNNQARI